MASGEVFVFCDLFQDGIEVLATILIFPLAAFFFFYLPLFGGGLSAAVEGVSRDAFCIHCSCDCSQQSLYE